MRTKIILRHETHPLIRPPGVGEPGQLAATVIACLVILLVFIVIAALA
jgi:hypothetical protein